MTPLSLHILLSLAHGPSHGYGILKSIGERTDGTDAPSTGALYLALQRLEREGYVVPAEAPSEDVDARRRYWRMTSDGRRAARAEVERMEALLGDAAVQTLRAGTTGLGA